MHNQLNKKMAIVTGAGQGLGRAIAIGMAKNGADIIVTDINRDAASETVAEIVELGQKALALAIDVTDSDSINQAIQQALDHFDSIDILVNNAGVAQKQIALATSDKDFDSCHQVNLKGVWAMTHALTPHFKARQAGNIINVSSIAGRGGIADLPAYSASKAGVISLTQSLAKLLGPDNINVNAVCPGSFWSPLLMEYLQLANQRNGGEQALASEEELFASMAQSAALRRVISPEDIADAVVFFASGSAKNITGQALNVDAGAIFN